MAPAAQEIRPRDRSREFDIVLLGATGFTGRLTAEYLATRYADADVRWALAGRNEAKLEALRTELAAKAPAIADVPIIIADSLDDASVDALAQRTSVVCTTVGPYARFGSGLVAACARHGTDCCDLTGELQWIRRMVDAHHEEAVASGARIVHCCGFDSIPSDLGTYVLQKASQERHGAPCRQVEFLMLGASGGFSGGTVASLLNVLDEARDPEVRKVLGNPYSLCPPGERQGPDSGDQFGPRYSKAAGVWTGPFLMEAINARVVRRSNALRGMAYGKDFRYGESVLMGKGPVGMLAAGAMSAGMGGFAAGAAVGPVRRLLERYVLPAPGEGPTPEAIASGFFKIRLVGSDAGDVSKGVTVEVVGKRDPGYGATSAMLAESALCLALDPLESPGGVLTPSFAMGDALVERLNASDVSFAVV